MFRISTHSTIACILLFVGCIQASELGKTTRVQLCISADSNKKATTSISIPRPWFLPSWIPWSETWCPRGTMKRSAIIYTPNGLEGDDVPLVMNIHALGVNAQGQQLLTGFDKTADENKFIVVYPEGFSKAKLGTPFPAPPGVPSYSFNAGGCCSDEPVDDINFLRKLIGFMESESGNSIDRERIYVTGMSNGGFMTNRVACEMSDLVAAAAPVAGVLFESYNLTTRHPLGWDKAPDFVCGPDHRVPILHTHNKLDNIVPFVGSAGVFDDDVSLFENDDKLIDYWGAQTLRGLGFPSVDESIEKWRKLNHVKDTGRVVVENSNTVCTLYSEPIEGKDNDFATVELCVITSKEAVGHCWPGSAGQGQFGQCLNEDVNNTFIWEFFTKHKRHERKTKSMTEDVGEEL